MATIIEFPALRSRASESDRSCTGPAEIVLFPGVRYERWSGEAPASSGRTKRRRDTLELDG